MYDEAVLLLTSQGLGLSVAVSPNEKHAAVGDDFGILYVFDLKLKALKSRLQAHMGPIRDMCFSKNSDYLITGGGDSKIVV